MPEHTTNVPLDSYMILRMLLEYYRNEKKAKHYIIKRLFNEFNGSQTNSTVNFSVFKDVLI